MDGKERGQSMRIKEPCACCGKIVRRPKRAEDSEGTRVWVGPECWRRIEASGEGGYIPEKSLEVFYPLGTADKKEGKK